MSNRTVTDILQILESTSQVGRSRTYVARDYTIQDLIDDLHAINEQEQESNDQPS